MKVTVVGCGRVGLAQAVSLSRGGHEVFGVEHDRDRFESLSQGVVPFHEPGLAAAMTQELSSGRLGFVGSASAAPGAGVQMLCVETPGCAAGWDLDVLYSAVREIAGSLGDGCVLVGRSTVPMGTAASVDKLVRALRAGLSPVRVVWSPEFLRHGSAFEDACAPGRIVLGAQDWDDSLRSLFQALLRGQLDAGAELFLTGWETAELAKLACNGFLATKLAYINAVASLSDHRGADFGVITKVMGADPRIGPLHLNAGLGYGGSCLGKDVAGLATVGGGESAGLAELMQAVGAINQFRRDRVVSLVCDAVRRRGSSTRVAVLGLAAKPGSDDVVDSPGMYVAERLSCLGVAVVAFDPVVVAAKDSADPVFEVALSAQDACDGADVVAVTTPWPGFSTVAPRPVADASRPGLVVDPSRVMDRQAWLAAGWLVST